MAQREPPFQSLEELLGEVVSVTLFNLPGEQGQVELDPETMLPQGEPQPIEPRMAPVITPAESAAKADPAESSGFDATKQAKQRALEELRAKLARTKGTPEHPGESAAGPKPASPAGWPTQRSPDPTRQT